MRVPGHLEPGTERQGVARRFYAGIHEGIHWMHKEECVKGRKIPVPQLRARGQLDDSRLFKMSAVKSAEVDRVVFDG